MKMIGIMTASGQGNLGDELILMSELQYVQNHSKAHIIVYTHDIQATKTFLQSQEHSTENISFRTYVPTNIRTRPFSNLISALLCVWDFSRMRICIIGGGGLLYDPQEQGGAGTHPVTLWAWRVRALRLFRVRCVFVGLGITTRRDLTWFFWKRDTILVRDSVSQKKLLEMQQESICMPDPVWMYPIQKWTWEYMGQVGCAFRASPHLNVIIEKLGPLSQKNGIKLVGIAHSLHPHHQHLDDQIYMQSLGIDATSNLGQSLEAYRYVDMVITNRFHGIILALLSDVAVLPIITNEKIARFCEAYGLKWIHPSDTDVDEQLEVFLQKPELYTYPDHQSKREGCLQVLGEYIQPRVK